MNEIQIFKNKDFGEIRTIEEEGKVLFCGSDVAKALGYKNPTEAIQDPCKGTIERCTSDSLGRRQKIKFVTEGDIYRLAARSKLPEAEAFERWIFDEVLPSIHKHGAYMTPETLDRMISSPEFGIRLLTALKDEQEKRKELEQENAAQRQRIGEMRPKEIFADAVSVSDDSILIGALAKIIKQNGVDMGQKRLFAWLRNNSFLMKAGSDYNMPTQRAMELGLFKIKERTINNPDGSVRITKTVLVTGKGQQYFVNKFLTKYLTT